MSIRFAFDNPGTEPVACCPDWSTDDFILRGFYEFEEGGEYAIVSCPHCEKQQRVDLPVSAWSIEKERNMKFQSEREAVEEIIADEKLTVDEMLERMPEGWTLISSEHFDRVVKDSQARQDRIIRLEKWLSKLRVCIVTACMKLGGGSGMAHRDKDATTLTVIHDLLALAKQAHTDQQNYEDDDIPF